MRSKIPYFISILRFSRYRSHRDSLDHSNFEYKDYRGFCTILYFIAVLEEVYRQRFQIKQKHQFIAIRRTSFEFPPVLFKSRYILPTVTQWVKFTLSWSSYQACLVMVSCLVCLSLVLVSSCLADHINTWGDVDLKAAPGSSTWEMLDFKPFIGKNLCGDTGSKCLNDFKNAVSQYKNGDSVQASCEKDETAVNSGDICWIRQKEGVWKFHKRTVWEMQFWLDTKDNKTSHCRFCIHWGTTSLGLSGFCRALGCLWVRTVRYRPMKLPHT